MENANVNGFSDKEKLSMLINAEVLKNGQSQPKQAKAFNISVSVLYSATHGNGVTEPSWEKLVKAYPAIDGYAWFNNKGTSEITDAGLAAFSRLMNGTSTKTVPVVAAVPPATKIEIPKVSQQQSSAQAQRRVSPKMFGAVASIMMEPKLAHSLIELSDALEEQGTTLHEVLRAAQASLMSIR